MRRTDIADAAAWCCHQVGGGDFPPVWPKHQWELPDWWVPLSCGRSPRLGRVRVMTPAEAQAREVAERLRQAAARSPARVKYSVRHTPDGWQRNW